MVRRETFHRRPPLTLPPYLALIQHGLDRQGLHRRGLVSLGGQSLALDFIEATHFSILEVTAFFLLTDDGAAQNSLDYRQTVGALER